MAKDKTWHGIPREDIPWYPTVDSDTCNGCTLCFVTCARGVYEMQGNRAVVVKPMDCMVGCSTCATLCPAGAISFPQPDVIRKLEHEREIFELVRQESKAKQEKLKARAQVEEAAAKMTTRASMEVVGESGGMDLRMDKQGLSGRVALTEAEIDQVADAIVRALKKGA